MTAAKPGKGADGGTGASGKTAEFWEGFTDAKLKESPVVLRHKTVEDLARSLTAAESKLGVPADQLIRVPSKPEDYRDVYVKLGAPETPEGYKIGLPDKATDADKAAAKSFAEHMHKAGPFPPDFVKAAVDWNNQQAEAAIAALTEQQTQAKAEGEAYLKKQLGAQFDPDMKAVGEMLAASKIEGLAEELNVTGLGDNPKLMHFLQTVVERLGEPGSLEGNGQGSGGQLEMTPGQAKSARITLENDPIKGPALRDSSHAMHKSVVEERIRLFALEDGRKYVPPA